MAIDRVSVEEVFAAHQAGEIALIDVREIDEVAAISSPLARNFPLSELDIVGIEAQYAKNAPLYLICKGGVRSMKAALMLQEAGFEHLCNVEGGILAWNAAGLPVVRG